MKKPASYFYQRVCVTWLIAGLLLVAGCESSQLRELMQVGRILLPPSDPPETKPVLAKQAPKSTTSAPAKPPERLPPLFRPLPDRLSSMPATHPPSAAQPTTNTSKMPSLIPYLTRQGTDRDEAAHAATAVPAPPPPRASAVRIAVLLPLSGPAADLGRAMQNAAQMAMFDFSDEFFEIVFHDTAGTPEGASEAARLAIGDGAALILGPLLGSSAEAVGPAARVANVPVISFSSDSSVAGNGVYTMGFVPGDQVDRIVAFARGKGITRFAVLAPDDPYGARVISALRRAADAADAVVTQVQRYNPLEDNFAHTVRQLADYESRREALMAQRRELEASSDDISKRALERLNSLQTVGDLPFEALLLADGGKRLLNIAALLPFYDIDPGKVRMLGTGQWDVPGIGSEPALLGGWYAAPPPAARTLFVDRYSKIYGTPPPRLASLAYDAAALAAVLARAEGGPRFSQAALTEASGFAGSDGIFRFLPSGRVERGLSVLRVGQRISAEIDPAPAAFTAPAPPPMN